MTVAVYRIGPRDKGIEPQRERLFATEPRPYSLELESSVENGSESKLGKMQARPWQPSELEGSTDVSREKERGV